MRMRWVFGLLLAAWGTGALADSSFGQSGWPVNNSPSHHTVPASSASRSVSDIEGSRRRYTRRNASRETDDPHR